MKDTATIDRVDEFYKKIEESEVNQKIKSVQWNLHPCGNSQEGFSIDWCQADIGLTQAGTKEVPKQILEYFPSGPHEKYFVLIIYESGASKKIFNPSEVDYYPVPGYKEQ